MTSVQPAHGPTIDSSYGLNNAIVAKYNAAAAPNLRAGIDPEHGIMGFFSAGASPTISEFSVYDRWGGLVTRLSDVDLATEPVFWDGRFNNQDALSGVYTFVLSGQFANGKEFFEHGTITLYR